ncbi:diphosphomevalonate decarboxylase [Weissella halotolerans]|uniref:diphosphomevalonate decarboxylase n=1 Tax=Weissella halotolerans DSM 20190 TaxID=1123500 RepID=A0A0R2G8F7_9LACO|nr:diphosphomevalonate decarboxylase [Weissella halotolerans]KRN33580.1 diphosphomevalonate decarboxylase [Weissella halotolerans DSM 20190]
MKHYTAKAHTNIALLKYWGKADSELIIPTTSSISLTLNEFYTQTTVWFDSTLDQDRVVLDGILLSTKASTKVVHLLNLVRQLSGLTSYAHVESHNHVPTAAGLASSASAFAALAGAASRASGLTLSRQDLSRLARRGSGSASRSIFGGFAQWERGHSDLTSFAKPIMEEVTWPIQLVTVLINDQPKKVSSRTGMQLAQTSAPGYQQWVADTNAANSAALTAIFNQDLATLGCLAEENALAMHALNPTATPPFTYLTTQSWAVIRLAQTLRNNKGIPVYATMDAGPNVKLISQPHDTSVIMQALHQILPNVQTQIATPGPGINIVEGDTI